MISSSTHRPLLNFSRPNYDEDLAELDFLEREAMLGLVKPSETFEWNQSWSAPKLANIVVIMFGGILDGYDILEGEWC